MSTGISSPLALIGRVGVVLSGKYKKRKRKNSIFSLLMPLWCKLLFKHSPLTSAQRTRNQIPQADGLYGGLACEGVLNNNVLSHSIPRTASISFFAIIMLKRIRTASANTLPPLLLLLAQSVRSLELNYPTNTIILSPNRSCSLPHLVRAGAIRRFV